MNRPSITTMRKIFPIGSFCKPFYKGIHHKPRKRYMHFRAPNAFNWLARCRSLAAIR